MSIIQSWTFGTVSKTDSLLCILLSLLHHVHSMRLLGMMLYYLPSQCCNYNYNYHGLIRFKKQLIQRNLSAEIFEYPNE